MGNGCQRGEDSAHCSQATTLDPSIPLPPNPHPTHPRTHLCMAAAGRLREAEETEPESDMVALLLLLLLTGGPLRCLCGGPVWIVEPRYQ